MSLTVLPNESELANLSTLDAVLGFAGLSRQIWSAISSSLGNIPSMRVLAMVPPDAFLTALREQRIGLLDSATGRPALDDAGEPAVRLLSMVESVQAGLTYRVCRLAYQLPDIDVLDPSFSVQSLPVSSTVVSGPAAIGSLNPSKTKKVKMSAVCDQLDDSEIDLLGQAEIDEAFAVYRSKMGADPLKEHEPSPEQISALKLRVVTHNESPYADFSLLTPFGRRTQKAMRAKGWMLQEDGSWKQLEVPGPPTFESWDACWQIYKTTLLMLRYPSSSSASSSKDVVTWAALDEYYNRIVRLAKTYPECWSLLVSAEDRARAEHLERARRQLSRALLEGRLPMNLSFSAEQPWVGAFSYVARDLEFWQAEVIIPAQNFLARGGAGKKMSKELADHHDVPPAAREAMENKTRGTVRPPGQGESRQAKRRRRDRERNDAPSPRDVPVNFGKSGSKGQQSHPKKQNGLFVTDREGNQLCFSYAKGEPGSCTEPCQNGRIHACQHCLGLHSNISCPKAKLEPKGKSNK
eukprot:s1087_g12.t1